MQWCVVFYRRNVQKEAKVMSGRVRMRNFQLGNNVIEGHVCLHVIGLQRSPFHFG
jgi:hypothetical protein